MICVLLIAMSGCGGGDSTESSPDNHGFGFAFDAVSTNGLHLRRPNDPGLWPGPIQTAVEFMEARFHTVEVCVGVTATPPFVVVLAPESIAGPAVGLYYSNPPLIVLDNDLAFEHEAVHYLLDFRNGNPDSGHADPAFRCASEV